MMAERFQNSYKPGPRVVIDETMIPFRGRIFFRQYIPSKRHKYGLKIFRLCYTNGYTWNFEIYCGKNDTYQHLGKTDSVTVRLMFPLLDMRMTLYTDNFYMSLPLAEYLLARKHASVAQYMYLAKGFPMKLQKQNSRNEKYFHRKVMKV